jgi:hypothetical protein
MCVKAIDSWLQCTSSLPLPQNFLLIAYKLPLSPNQLAIVRQRPFIQLLRGLGVNP